MIIRNTIFSIEPPVTHNVLWIKAGANNNNTLNIYDGGWRKIGTATGGGSSDYNDLENKPSINGVTLSGNLTTEQLKIIIPELSKYLTKNDLDATLTEYAKKSDIPNLENIFTKEEADKLYQPVGEYATKQELSNKADVTYVDDELSKKQDKGDYALKSDLSDLATKAELNTKVDSSALESLATKEELNTKVDTSELTKYATVEALNEKPSLEQVNSSVDTKIEAQEFKTINGESIVGKGEITISGGGSITVDKTLNPESENAVSNKAVAELLLKLDEKVFPITFNVYGGGTFAEGTSQTIEVSWKLEKEGRRITPDTVTVNGEEVTNTNNSKEFYDVTTTTTYNVVVTYKGKQYKGSTTATFRKTYYRYYGALPVGTSVGNITESMITSLTKEVCTSASATLTYNLNDQRAVYAYPSTFGLLTKVLDDTTSMPYDDFVKEKEMIIEGENYYIYALQNPTRVTNYKFRFVK